MAVILGLALGATGHAGPLRIALLSEAIVTSDAIMLSRLLPENSSQVLKMWAEKVSLGTSPNVGFERRLGRLVIAEAIRTAVSSGADFAIPEMVVVRRQGRAISREEICEILRHELATRGSPQSAEINVEDVELQSTWEIPGGAKGIRLKELVADPLLGRTRFRLRWVGSSSAPELYGWLRLKANDSKTISKTAGDATDELAVKPIVVANRLALLFLHSQNSETLMRVRVLQPGRLGDSIRVRIPANGHTLMARVVGQDRLDLSF